MSTSFNFDGDDLLRKFEMHSFRKRWLMKAEAWLSSDRDVESLTTYDIRTDGSPTFRFDVPRSIWEPQLRQQVEVAKQEIAELDRIIQDDVEAALKEPATRRWSA